MFFVGKGDRFQPKAAQQLGFPLQEMVQRREEESDLVLSPAGSFFAVQIPGSGEFQALLAPLRCGGNCP